MDVWQLLAAVLGGGALMKISDALVNVYRARSTELRADDAQVFAQHDKLFSDLRMRITELEKHTIDCLKQHSETNRQLGLVQGRLDEQTRAMQHMQETAAESSRKALEVAGEVAARGIVVAAKLAAVDSLPKQQPVPVPTPVADPRPTEVNIAIDNVHS